MAKVNEKEIDVLRAHAIAAALRKAKPEDYLINDPARITWYNAVTQVSSVVCTSDGVSLSAFFDLCGVPD